MRHVNILPDSIRSTVLANNNYLQHETNYYTFAYFIKDLQQRTGSYDVNDQFKDLQLSMYTGLKLYLSPQQTVIGLNDSSTQLEEKPIIGNIRFTFASETVRFDNVEGAYIKNLVDIFDTMADTLVSYTRLNLLPLNNIAGTIEIKAEDDIDFVEQILSRLQTRLSTLYPQVSFSVSTTSRIELPVEIETDHRDLTSSFWSDQIIPQRIKLLLFSDMSGLFYSVENGLLPIFHQTISNQVLHSIDYITFESDFSLIQHSVSAGENDAMSKSLLEIRKFQLDEIITQVQNIRTSIQEQVSKDQYRQLTQLHGDLRNFATSFDEIVDRIYNEPHQNLAELEGLIKYISEHIRETEQWLELILYQNSL